MLVSIERQNHCIYLYTSAIPTYEYSILKSLERAAVFSQGIYLLMKTVAGC